MQSATETERRLRALEDGYLVMGRDLKVHLLACERRGTRLERLAWAIGTLVVGILGVLLKAHFNL